MTLDPYSLGFKDVIRNILLGGSVCGSPGPSSVNHTVPVEAEGDLYEYVLSTIHCKFTMAMAGSYTTHSANTVDSSWLGDSTLSIMLVARQHETDPLYSVNILGC